MTDSTADDDVHERIEQLRQTMLSSDSSAARKENIKKELEERFLTPSNQLPAHWLADWQTSVELGVQQLLVLRP